MIFKYLQTSIILLALPSFVLGQNAKAKKAPPQYKDPIDRKTDSVLNKMTLEEKIGQLTLFTSDWERVRRFAKAMPTIFVQANAAIFSTPTPPLTTAHCKKSP